MHAWVWDWRSSSLASSPGHSQILSRSHGEKSGEGLGSKLCHGLEMVDSVSTNRVHHFRSVTYLWSQAFSQFFFHGCEIKSGRGRGTRLLHHFISFSVLCDRLEEECASVQWPLTSAPVLYIVTLCMHTDIHTYCIFLPSKKRLMYLLEFFVYEYFSFN